jgi:hypothetical protein
MNYLAQFSRDPAVRLRHMTDRSLEQEFRKTLQKVRFQGSVVAGLRRLLIEGRSPALQSTLEYHLSKVRRKRMWLDLVLQEADRRGLDYEDGPDDSDVRTIVVDE